MEKVLEYTIQEILVSELAPKVYAGFYPITFLHDNERELLAGYVLDHEDYNENAQQAINDKDYDVYDLGQDAYRIIFKERPEMFV